jgi:hypothetical protein
MIKELANLLHNAGLNAFTHPRSKDQQSWNEYREGIAKELIDSGVMPTNTQMQTGACHIKHRVYANNSDLTNCPVCDADWPR